MYLYSMELNLIGKTALVVGLGSVGRRKALGLLAAGAKVIGVDPSAGGGACLPLGVEVLADPYQESHLEGVALAFASATPEINRQVVADAKRRGIWVNSASDPGEGDFTLPAVWRDGPLTLTVSTTGASPALSTLLRDRAAEALGPAAAGLATLLAELRPMVLAKIADPQPRRLLFESWADPRWLDLWNTKGPEAVRTSLIRSLEATIAAMDQGQASL